jgi:glycosyltransferase involved in cell wall biosynthesis
MSAGIPKVSVIIPAHNAERYIRDSLDSVLAQSYSDLEVIVVDDGSTDGTRDAVLAVKGPIRCLTQVNAGPSAARNAGIAAARGELICFLDADDLWTPDKLQRQVAFMEEHPEVGLVFSDEEEFDDAGVHCPSLLATTRYGSGLGPKQHIEGAFQKLLEENFIPTSTVMARRRCFDAAGLFDVALRAAEDRDMWARIAVTFPLVCMPERLGSKRVVAGSASRDVETTLRSRILHWTKARRLFPELARPQRVNALLGSTYVHLGFVLLHKGRLREARQYGAKVFSASRRPSEWFLAGGLLVLTVAGSGATESLFRTKRRLANLFHRPAL